MAKKKSQKNITDAYIRRSLTLLRAAEGEASNAASMLDEIHKSIILDISSTFENPTFREVNEIKKIADKKLETFYKGQWPKELVATEKEVIAREVIWNSEILASVAGESVFSPPASGVLKKAAKKSYQGHTFSYWIKNSFGNESKRIKGALDTGFNEGKSIAQVVSSIENIMGKASRDAKTITRSHFMHTAREAKREAFERNASLIESQTWVSTLDNRTTALICGVRDGLEYDLLTNEPIGHVVPWDAGPGRIHWNCRSTSVPNVKGVRNVGKRAAVGAGSNYTKGDNTTNRGTVRKSHKDAEDRGIYKTEIKTSLSKYEGWLRAESKKNINFVSDVLKSKSDARLFRDGKVSLFELGLENPVANVLNRTDI